eukprot:1917383-Amphidinium_carterae.1
MENAMIPKAPHGRLSVTCVRRLCPNDQTWQEIRGFKQIPVIVLTSQIVNWGRIAELPLLTDDIVTISGDISFGCCLRCIVAGMPRRRFGVAACCRGLWHGPSHGAGSWHASREDTWQCSE